MDKILTINDIIDEFVELEIKRSPSLKIALGNHDNHEEVDDYSYQGVQDEINHINSFLEKLDKVQPKSKKEALGKKVLTYDLLQSKKAIISSIGIYQTGVIDSIFTDFNQDIEQINYDSIVDVKKYIEKLKNFAKELANYRETLKIYSNLGVNNTSHNIDRLIFQAEKLINEEYYKKYLQENKYLNSEIEKEINESYDMLNQEIIEYINFLKNDLKPKARKSIGIGRDLYQLAADINTEEDIDLNELYNYGLNEVERLNNEIDQLHQMILPGSSREELVSYLDNHDLYKIKSKEELKNKLTSILELAVITLEEKIFEIDPKIKEIEIVLDDDSIDASPYYLQPSPDFKIKGKVVFPTMGKDEFSIWKYISTWFHESIPGHHLQVGNQLLNKKNLTSYQNKLAWHSAYGEGWALHSENLANKLGYLDDPGYKLGYLQAQILRAARLVLDIGLHLELNDPEGRTWSHQRAVRYLREVVMLDEEEATSEIDRYLSIPGQALSYKVGERTWESLLMLAKQELKEDFSPKKFYSHALRLGSLPLDIFKDEMREYILTEKLSNK